MRRRQPWYAAAALAGLLCGWWLARPASSPPPSAPPAAPPLAASPPARGEPPPADAVAPTAALPPSASATSEALAPVRCALDLGPTPPDSLRYSWRATVLGDPAVSPAELAARVRARARTAVRGPDGYDLRAPPQADLLLVLDHGRVSAALPLAWHDGEGRCASDSLEVPSVPIAGRVAGVEADDEVEVFLCGRWLPVDAQGRFAGAAPARADCVAFASRRDGALSALGGFVDLDLSAGGRLEDLLLDLPAVEIAGVGAVLQVVEGGAEVLDVLPGGAAAEGGMQPGELVVQVDGEDIAGWPLAEVIAAVTGPAGTEVELLIVDEAGGERRLALTRAPIAAPDDP